MAKTNPKRMTELTANHTFSFRARQEVSRAERYCLFLSLMLIDTKELSRALQARKSSPEMSDDDLRLRIEEGVRGAVRASDVVSAFEQNRIGVLLMETSRAGLEIVKQRINLFLVDYLRGTLQLPFEPAVSIRDASFPEESEQFNQLAQLLGRNQAASGNGN